MEDPAEPAREVAVVAVAAVLETPLPGLEPVADGVEVPLTFVEESTTVLPDSKGFVAAAVVDCLAAKSDLGEGFGGLTVVVLGGGEGFGGLVVNGTEGFLAAGLDLAAAVAARGGGDLTCCSLVLLIAAAEPVVLG